MPGLRNSLACLVLVAACPENGAKLRFVGFEGTQFAAEVPSRRRGAHLDLVEFVRGEDLLDLHRGFDQARIDLRSVATLRHPQFHADHGPAGDAAFEFRERFKLDRMTYLGHLEL